MWRDARDGYIEDPSEFEQEHETARAFALRGVFTGCRRVVNYVNNKRRLITPDEVVPGSPEMPDSPEMEDPDDESIWHWPRYPWSRALGI